MTCYPEPIDCPVSSTSFSMLTGRNQLYNFGEWPYIDAESAATSSCLFVRFGFRFKAPQCRSE
jgi:hypothetical protein